MQKKVISNNQALPPPLVEEQDTVANEIMQVSHAIEDSIQQEENIVQYHSFN